MNQLSPSARRLFELVRGQDEPDIPTQSRVARALATKIATGAILTGGGASAATSLVGWGAIAAKSALAVGVSGALVAAGWFATRPARPPHPVVPSTPEPAAVTAPAPVSHVEETPSPEPLPLVASGDPATAPVHRRPARPSARPTPATAPVAEDDLRSEAEALRLAQQALRDEMPQQAIRLLDEQDRRFRDGQLGQERAAARVLALCQGGRVGEARAQALRFERLWPRSALLGRVRAACWTP